MRVRIRVALSLGKVLTQGRKDEANARIEWDPTINKGKDTCPRKCRVGTKEHNPKADGPHFPRSLLRHAFCTYPEGQKGSVIELRDLPSSWPFFLPPLPLLLLHVVL
uniref:Uncharacterized protein n=1 Tax=Cucumis sativus TaxID=3659 RepID=A0A0A0LE93_CUCSA